MTRSLALLYGVIVASFLNLFWQFPLTPVLAQRLTSESGLVALTVSAYSLANMVGNLFAGLVVDRFDRRRVMAVGLAAGALALALAGRAPSAPLLAGALALNGLAIAVVTPAAFARLSQLLPDAFRARGMASSGAAIGVAALVGAPAAGALADRLGEGGAFGVAGAGLFALALLAFWGGRGEAQAQAQAQAQAGGPGPREVLAMLGDRRLHLGFFGAFVLMLGNGGLVFALPPHLKALGAPGAMIGAMFSCFALSAIAVLLSPLGRRAYAGRPWRALAVGAAVIASAFAGLALAPTLPLIALAMAVYGVGFGLIYPAALAAVACHSDEERRGTAFGLFYALFSLGAALGPFWLAAASGFGLTAFAAAAVPPALLAVGLLALHGPRRSAEA